MFGLTISMSLYREEEVAASLIVTAIMMLPLAIASLIVASWVAREVAVG
jgi:hypothetical protein